MTLITMIAINTNQQWQPWSSEAMESRSLISFMLQFWPLNVSFLTFLAYLYNPTRYI